MKLTLSLGIAKARTKFACERAGGTYRKSFRRSDGTRVKAVCARPQKGSPKRQSASMARFVKRGTKCKAGEVKTIVRSPTNPRGTQQCRRRR